MARPLRLEFPGAWYHVMNRGAGRKDIFKCDEHRMMFLELLADASRIFQVEVHGYCMMDNHYHLLIHTPLGNLSRSMRHINGIYTQRFNRAVNSDGPLFRGRYKAILVQEDNYLLHVSRYIHLNPVEARMVKDPSAYQWSSYPQYLNLTEKDKWLYTGYLLEMNATQDKRQQYQKFVEYGNEEEIKSFYKKKQTPTILGDEDYKKKLLHKLDDKKILEASTDYNRTRCLPDSEKILQATCEIFGEELEFVCKSQRGTRNTAKMLAIYACRKLGAMKNKEIAKLFGLNSLSSVSSVIASVEELLNNDGELEAAFEDLKIKVDKDT